MSHTIHHQEGSTFGFERGLYFYIDTDKSLEKKITGVFTDTYDTKINDLAGKKFKFLTDREKLTGVRYLHAVKKDKKEVVENVCDKFKIKVPSFSKVDDRKIVYEDDKTTILEYTPGVSYAIFTTSENLESYLRENRVMRNAGLTASDGKIKPGFVLGFKKATKDDFLKKITKLAQEGDVKYEGDEIQQEPDSPRGNKVFTIWGSTDYLLECLTSLKNEDNTLKTLDSKPLCEGRVYHKVEVYE